MPDLMQEIEAMANHLRGGTVADQHIRALLLRLKSALARNERDDNVVKAAVKWYQLRTTPLPVEGKAAHIEAYNVAIDALAAACAAIDSAREQGKQG